MDSDEASLSGTKWDCHFHIFEAPEAAALRGVQLNPSQRGTVTELKACLGEHGLGHGLAVGAAPYGTDNRVLVEALKASGGRLRGVGVVSPAISDRDFEILDAAGVVGARVNLMTWGPRQLLEPGADRLLARLKEANWFLQLHVSGDDLLAVVPLLRRAGVRLLFDHLGRPDPRRGLAQPGFQAMLELGRSSDSAVKLSGPYRFSADGPPYLDTDEFVESAIEAFTVDRCVWGSDWPFTNPPHQVSYPHMLAALHRWVPDHRDLEKVLTVNPQRLFGRGRG